MRQYLREPRVAPVALRDRDRPRPGFTLIELLVVIAVIAVVAAILFPVFAQVREKARATTCLSNCQQMATGVNMLYFTYDME